MSVESGLKGRVGGVTGRGLRHVAALGRALEAALVSERERLALWIPVALGLGISVYFALPAEPGGHIGALALALAGFALIVARRGGGPLILAIAFAAATIGFQAALWRTGSVAAPVLAKRLGPVAVEGRVMEVAAKGKGVRVVLERLVVRGLPPRRTPARARVTVAKPGTAPPRVGERIRLLAVLMPPPGPAAPGAFDFARQAYFRQLGAVGFAIGAPERVAAGMGVGEGSWRVHVGAWRAAISARVREALEGPPGAVAAALMTGDRGAIPESVLDDLRASGLAHLLAISGLHIGLIAMVLFFGTRAVLALIPAVALRWPIKKWAAVVALFGAFGYLVLTGATVPTQRAFMMTALVLVAVLTDRRAISMRLVALAAAVILLARPESLLSVSFQMSFAAVVGLVAGYETFGPKLAGWRAGGGMERRILIYLAGVALTTVIASLATAPFAAYHFNRVAHFGLLANLFAVPTMAGWIMPWAVLAYVAMPLGLEGVPLAFMGWGIEAVIATAGWVAGLPGATARIAAMAPIALPIIGLGGLWLCLWRGRWRMGGLAMIFAGLLLGPFERPPDLLIDRRGKLVALPDGEGRLHGSRPGISGYGPGVWLRRAGEADFARGGLWRCDGLGCIADHGAARIAHVRDARALPEDCALVAVIISSTPVRVCPGARLVLDRFDFWREGPHAVWLSEKGDRVVSSLDLRGARPWVARRGQ